jgi:hypothetical protein
MTRGGGCLGRLLLLVLLFGVGALAWQHRARLLDRWDGARGRQVAVSPELAALADQKLARLSEDGDAQRVALRAPELQSLIEYRWSGMLPPDIGSPRVGLTDGRVTLEANVATARFGRVAELRDIVAFLPDTAGLRAVGTFTPLQDGQVALEVHEMAAASIPVPRRLIPTVLSRFPGAGENGLAPNAVAIPLPPGISTIYVSGDSMVFVAQRSRRG